MLDNGILYDAYNMKQVQRVHRCRPNDWLRESLGMLAQILGAKKSTRIHHSMAKSKAMINYQKGNAFPLEYFLLLTSWPANRVYKKRNEARPLLPSTAKVTNLLTERLLNQCILFDVPIVSLSSSFRLLEANHQTETVTASGGVSYCILARIII